MRKLFLTLGIVSLLTFSIQAQEKTNEVVKTKESKSAFVEIKDGAKPDVYIDGKKYDSEILDLIDPDKIKSISVYKGESAMEKFQTENVIEIITKKNESRKKKADTKKDNMNITVKSDRINIISYGKANDNEKHPVIIIDGKLKNKEEMKELSPDDIEQIEVLKDEKTLKKYNTKVGVILITTKNKK